MARNTKRGLETRDIALKAIKENKKIDWSENAVIQEMITTADGGSAFVQKVTYEVYDARDAVPLVYTDFYQVINDRNLPKLLEINKLGPSQVIFLEKMEGGEVRFGVQKPGTKATVKIITYAAGFEVTEDMIEYNQLFDITDLAREMGEVYNYLLNHIHMSPIITGTYTTTAGGLVAQKKAQIKGTAQLIAFSTDLKTTLRNALTMLPFGTNWKAVINSVDLTSTLDTIGTYVNADQSASVVKRTFTADKFVAYDGVDIEVGDKTYTYAGVTAGDLYLVSTAKRNYKSYVKHDLIIDAGNADLSRLIEEQQVGRARIGVAAQNGGRYGTVKVKLS